MKALGKCLKTFLVKSILRNMYSDNDEPVHINYF